MSERTGLKGKELAKVKFCLVPRSGYGKAYYLEDGKLLFD
jgi:hypothetical protein